VALFGPTERRSLTARLVHGSIYVVLALGSVTMVYPFLVMLGSSVTTDLDFNDWRVIPAYLTDDVALFRKWLDDRYGDDFRIGRRVHHLKIANFNSLESIPDVGADHPTVRRRVDDWLECMKQVPEILLEAFYRDKWRTRPAHQKFARWLSDRYDNDIEAFNTKFHTAYTAFNQVVPCEVVITHQLRSPDSLLYREYLEFRETLPRSELMPILATDGFLDYVSRHVGGARRVNALLGTHYSILGEMVFPAERPAQSGPLQELWDTYVTKRFPLLLVRVKGDFDAAYREFLGHKYPDYDARVAAYNVKHGTHLPGLAETVFPPTMPQDDLRYADWSAFADRHVPPEAKQLTTVEGIWRDWLRGRYGSLDRVNGAHGTSWRNWSEVMPPRAETDVVTFWRNKEAIREEFLLRNYRLVLDYILFHGRALLNTVILVVMTVLGQLTVQPLAAYGLSRFRLRYAHKILLFLLATMAFPAEVAMIPNFLLIKELNLLNTYWALVLPGLASGMGIFLLKGYFDSLPQELYEAAMMDGASELRMFLQITIPLSKPILAVIALTSFVAAYGGFMWAFLICQKPYMWTMMVFLWQLGHETYSSVWMASLVIAAIPTLLVFIFCQKIILRGIIVPTMK
jgi:ABC-type glycerol-3-phosphate transport system permease component